MSVQSEIERIKQSITNAYAVLKALGCDIPEEQTSDNLAQTAGTSKVVKYEQQSLSDSQKSQARTNIGAASAEHETDTSMHIVYGVCDTAADVLDKVVTVEGNFVLKTGVVVIVKFTNANSIAAPTLNVNGTGAKPMYRYGTTTMSTGTTTTGWIAGAVQMFTYDGTGWCRDYWNNTTYSNASMGSGYATCSTAEATTAKVGTLSSYSLTTGGIVSVKFTNAVPANATLNINSKGAKNIYYRGAKITAGIIKAGDIATFVYSSYYHLISIDRWQEDVKQLSEQIADMNVLNPDSFNGTDSEKLQACYDALATTGGVISINRTYTLTDNIKIKHDSGSSNQIITRGTGKVSGIEFGNYFFTGYDETTKGYGGLVFEHLRLNGASIGFDCNHLIRLIFNACVIRNFTNLAYADDYIQTVYLNDCAIRYSLGATIKTANNTSSKCYDVRIRGCLAEWGVSLFDTPNVYGCSIVQNCIEGFTDTPIIVRKYLHMLDISSNYFELNGNGVSVDLSNIGEVSTGNISNNSFIENETGRKGSILLPKIFKRSLIISGNIGTNVVEVQSGATDLSGVYYFANNGGIINKNDILTPINPSDIISMLGSGVASVNGKDGEVILSAEDVGATTKGYVDNAITNLNAQGIQQTFCMAQGTTLEECLAWLNEYGDETKAYIMHGSVSDEVYGFFSKRTEVVVKGCTNHLENKILINHRISASGTPSIKDANGMVTSATSETEMAYIKVKGGDIIRVNLPIDPSFKSGYPRVVYCKSDKTKVSDYTDGTAVSQVKMTESNGVTSWTVGYKSDGTKMSSYDSIEYMLINICIRGDGVEITDSQAAGIILTVNEEIKDDYTKIEDVYSWESTGHKFITS